MDDTCYICIYSWNKILKNKNAAIFIYVSFYMNFTNI